MQSNTMNSGIGPAYTTSQHSLMISSFLIAEHSTHDGNSSKKQKKRVMLNLPQSLQSKHPPSMAGLQGITKYP